MGVGGDIRRAPDIIVGFQQVRHVSLSGDFFCHPRDAISDLESAIEGTLCTQLGAVIARFYATHDIETPGVSETDWVKVLLIE
jgi:hypothetical protein